MNLYTKYLFDFKKHYILYIPLSIILQSCVGSIAAMYVLMNHNSSFYMFELSLCVIVTMSYNASIMAQFKHKWVFNLLILTLIVNIGLIVINIMRLQ